MPQYNQLKEDSFKRPEPIRVITAVPKAKEMETLALISALQQPHDIALAVTATFSVAWSYFALHTLMHNNTGW